MLTEADFQGKLSKFQVALITCSELVNLWLLHPYWFQTVKDLICTNVSDIHVSCTVISAKLPNRFIELSSCHCIKTYNMIASGTFSAMLCLMCRGSSFAAVKITGEKTGKGQTWSYTPPKGSHISGTWQGKKVVFVVPRNLWDGSLTAENLTQCILCCWRQRFNFSCCELDAVV